MDTQSRLENGWFREICAMWEGISLSLKVEKILYSQKSAFQQIDVYETKRFGRMLVLDGIIQLTERDEFSYQEMMAHVPVMSHPDPKDVLVIGGGDGGILRELGRHNAIETMDFCEVDEAVIRVSRQFLPGLACGFDDPRVCIHIRDGNEFIQEQTGAYDVIIVDSSDPVGPGQVLFEKPFYQGLKQALKPGGIVATQGESFFLHPDYVQDLIDITRDLFDHKAYATITVPTYPGGHISMCMGSLGPRFGEPVRPMPDGLQEQLRYYSPDIHRAAFVQPWFAAKMLNR